MIKQIVAKRYAKAIFQIVQSGPSREAHGNEAKAGPPMSPRPMLAPAKPEARLEKELDRTLKILRQASQAFKEHVSFRHIMLNPAFDQEVKISVLKAFLEKIQANGPAVKFLEYLVRKNRCGYLEEISRSFSIMMDEFLKIIRIPISTARELSREEQETLRQHLEAATGRKVEMQWSVNPSLIGGMVVRIGEAVVDGSILGQLQAIRRSLIKTA